MKRLMVTLSGSLLLALFFLTVGKPGSAAACTIALTACGYFTTSPANATDNVLPPPALQNVNTASVFISTLQGDLYSADPHTSIGAAFIIDDMLNYNNATGGQAGGGVAAGIAYAKTNLGAWVNMVNFYNSSTNPGYGINWSYTPTIATFCGSAANPTLDSAYDPVLVDVALYYAQYADPANCNFEYVSSMPEIMFYWPGGTFEIGTLCGNVQGHPGPIPLNSPPIGTISVACDFSTDQQQATVTYSDPDGPTSGYITTGGSSYPVISGKVFTIPSSSTSTYNTQPVTLYVVDAGPLGSNSPVQVASANTQVPCVTFQCGSMRETPSLLDPYMNYTLTTTVTNSTTTAPPSSSMSLQVTSPTNVVVYSKPNNPVTANGLLLSSTFNPPPTGGTGQYTAQWTLTIPGKSISCTGTFDVVNLPYLNVYGGDISAGISAAYNGSSSTCSSQNKSAGIFSWNNRAPNFSGAGAQYAVQALAAIEDFASGQDRSGTVTPPIGLSIANTQLAPGQVDIAQGLFGGYSTVSTGDCDFTSDLAGATTINGPMVFPGRSVSKKNDVWLVKGDVYISDNIVYTNTGNWANVNQIPYFKLVVVGGNIYIDDDVMQLDGVYVAEPQINSGGAMVGGIIYTCASGMGKPTYASSSPTYYVSCNKKLVINGAFVARQVQFLRTGGSVGQAQPSDTLSNNHAAEVFNFTPEVWLPRGGTPTSTGYKAITGLPPVL